MTFRVVAALTAILGLLGTTASCIPPRKELPRVGGGREAESSVLASIVEAAIESAVGATTLGAPETACSPGAPAHPHPHVARDLPALDRDRADRRLARLRGGRRWLRSDRRHRRRHRGLVPRRLAFSRVP